MGKVLCLRDAQPKYSLQEMILNPKKREEIFNHYDSIYQETEEEKEIFEKMSQRRKR